MASLTSPRTPRTPRATSGRRRSSVLLLIGPFFFLFAFTYLGPILYAFGLSLFRERFAGIGWDGPEKVFAGLDNYSRALTDTEFLTGVGRVLLYGLIYVPLLIALASVFALLLDSAVTAFRRTWQTVLFLPHIVPGLIASIVWLYLYTPGLSPVIDGLEVLGWEVDFLHGATVLFSLVNIAVWSNLGFNVVLIFVALQAIPRSTIEAARLDGAGEARIGLRVKLPQVLPAMMVATLFTIIGSLQLFTEPYILQASGNSSVSSTWTPNMLSYTAAFQSNDYHYAATVSVLVAVLAGVLSFTVTKISNRRALR
ncbi:carbohydrate ABC transporter membrane protein 1, CUT1 family [Streptomyces zhaozhouensis]|uniref:Carbohydrate ABC transporter membrane protein 1, CUT1 family n=1 Tax=Streptomyces zhaozhouensis TaxID=1300267 RepID=A0A286DY65_9ACTN|nr:sugar ABC transporter permease [Streptomyces zhaozhouensis]SOD63583.1 carbohydrate ABC transporter membrane protein 1, CUT1 family [Streptomyces zhaozhouensis]